METSLAHLGYARERRPFTPHITLARLRPPQDLRRWIDQAERPRFAPFQAAGFELIESDLRPDGARYTALRLFRFGALDTGERVG